jgi:dinuclear metal center YbgI/SA1388 family protein
MTVLLRKVIEELERIAPTRYAEAWDNVGLLAGDPWQEISRGILTIDYTSAVAQERKQLGCELVIAYHPPIFQAIKRLTAGSSVFDAIRNGVAIYSPHTALDVADGGTNDVLCDVMGVTRRSPLKLAETKASQYKLVTFVPESALESVSGALFDAGAGRIGKYSACSFRAPGTGTFFGEEGTNPAVGQSGRPEQAQEIRLETVVPISKIGHVIEALRKSHPYEEPAFDLNQLAAPPENVGIGRVGEFDKPIERSEIFARIKRGLGIDHLLIAGPTEGSVQRVAACAGACGDLLNDAVSEKADLYLTGEMRHHDAIKAAAAGMTVVCTLHSNSERLTLRRLKQHLEERLPGGPAWHLSQQDLDPFAVR